MKVIILCAGKGQRTGLKYPKCLYTFSDGSKLIEKNINILKEAGFKNKDIIFATGYKENLIKSATFNKHTYIKNKFYSSTNMVYSFFKVLENIKTDDFLVVYADIIFDFKSLISIKNSKYDLCTLVDLDWLQKWKQKKNYMDDLEELKINRTTVTKIGKKTYNLKNIDGRYVGITKISEKIINKMIKQDILQNLLKKNRKLDFTNFLMEMIKSDIKIKAIKKKVNWFEFDKKDDFITFEKNKKFKKKLGLQKTQ